MKTIILLMAKPFLGLWKFLFKPLTLKSYKLYLKIKNKINKSPLLKSKIGLIFYNRHTVHVVIVFISIFIASTNVISAREVRHNVAKESPLYKVVQDSFEIMDESEIVVTNKNNKRTKKNYVATDSLVVANIPQISDQKKKVNNNILIGEGSTLTSTNVMGNDVSKKRAGIEEYTVQEGDTISEIAGKFGLSLNTLYWANNMNADSVIKPGITTLKIPPASGILHKVVEGDTLDSIINKHDGDKAETKKVNDIGSDDLIPVGQEILVVGGKPYTPPAPAAAPASSSSSSGSSGSSWGDLFTNGSGSNVTGGTLNWPSACRRISQGVRWGHIAIDINCGFGNPIYAAESGTVSVIPNRGNGYGNYVIINHGNGMQTLYGHLSSFTVQNGQYVSRGQQIGVEGSTGWSTGPHLHFEVMVNGAKQNPWSYL